MTYYLYFSYYDAYMNNVGFDMFPSVMGEITPDWVVENLVISAPSETVVAVVSLDTNPPTHTPIWLEFFGVSELSGY